MDSFSPGNGSIGSGLRLVDSLTLDGGIDDIIRESSDDIDLLTAQWPPLCLRKQGI